MTFPILWHEDPGHVGMVSKNQAIEVERLTLRSFHAEVDCAQGGE